MCGERQRHMIIYVKAGMCHYCFIRVNDYMLVYVMVFVSKFGRAYVRNVVAGYRLILCMGFAFVSFVLYRFSLTF